MGQFSLNVWDVCVMMLQVNAKPPPRTLHSTRDWAHAEENAASWMRHWGFADARVTGPGSDRGIDVRAREALAQVKFQNRLVGRPAVQNLVGARENDHSKALLFFSNLGYAAPAIRYADTMNVALFTYDKEGAPTAVNWCARRLVKETQATFEQRRRSRRRALATFAGVTAIACLGVLFIPFTGPEATPDVTRDRQTVFGALSATFWLLALWGWFGGAKPDGAPAASTAEATCAGDPAVGGPATSVVKDAYRAPDSLGPRQAVKWQPVMDEDPPWFDYRASVQEALNALVAVHARGDGSLPALDNERSEVTIVPDWAREYQGVKFLKARLDPSPASPSDTIRVYWSTYSTASSLSDEVVNDAAQEAADRANNALANLLGRWAQEG